MSFREAPLVWFDGAACAVLRPHESCAADCQQVIAHDGNYFALMRKGVLWRGLKLCCRWQASLSRCHPTKHWVSMMSPV